MSRCGVVLILILTIALSGCLLKVPPFSSIRYSTSHLRIQPNNTFMFWAYAGSGFGPDDSTAEDIRNKWLQAELRESQYCEKGYDILNRSPRLVAENHLLSFGRGYYRVYYEGKCKGE